MAIAESVAAWVAQVLRPLAYALGSEDEDLIRFVAELGWDLPSVPPALRAAHANLAQVHDRLVELDEAQWRVATTQAPPTAIAPVLGALLAEVVAVADDLHTLGGRLRTELPAPYVAATNIDGEFEGRVLDWLVFHDVAGRSAIGYGLLRLAGVLEETDEPEDPSRHQPEFVRRRVRWERLVALLRDPGSVARDVYGWGTRRIDAERLFGALVPLSFAVAAPGQLHYPEPEFVQAVAPGAVDPPDGPDPQLWIPVFETDELSLLLAVFAVPTTNAQQPQAVAVTLVPSGEFGTEVPLGGELALTLEAAAQVGSGAALVLRPGESPSVVTDVYGTPESFAGGRFAAAVARRPPGADGADGPGLTGAVRLGAEGGTGGVEVFAELGIEKGRLIITAPAGDGLLTELMPAAGITVPVTATVRWSNRGLRFTGAAGLETLVPLDVMAGPLRLRDLRLGVLGSGDAVTATAGVTAALALGPVTLALSGLGVRLDGRARPGNLGPFDLAVGATTPTGAEIAIAAGPARGGGTLRFDPPSGRYSGAFAVRLGDIAVQGYGLLDTRPPGGGPGYSLLVMLSARFPGIQLGFGIVLTRVGGLVGVNRRIDVDALRERFTSGTAARILAPEDPVRDLPSVLTELAASFPVARGIFVVGPTLRLEWVQIVTLDVGVFLEFPGPTRIVLLGTARASIEHPLARGPLLRLRADFIGELNLVRATLECDAVLVDSRLLEDFPVTGGLTVRARWGDDPYAVLSVGGFHPDFAPPGLVLPKTLTPLAMSSGEPDDRFYLRFEGYLAITPNTLQFGASVEVAAKLGRLRVRGFIGFDTLVRRAPFYFRFDFAANLRVQWGDRTLAGLKVTGRLSGPGPVVFTGKACVEMLFVSICGSATFELGSDAPPLAPTSPPALDVLAAALRDPANLRAAGDDPMVILHPLSATAPLVVPPVGLIWEQRHAPLGLLLHRLDGAPLARPEIVTASSPAISGEELDWFAPGGFADLTEAEALTRRSFERLAAGLQLAAGDDHESTGIPHTIEVEVIVIPRPPQPPGQRPALDPPAWLLDASDAREGGPGRPRPAPRIRIRPERWLVRTADGPTALATSESQAHQAARAAGRGAVAVPATDVIALTQL